MPLITEYHDSLPYVDASPTADDRARIAAAIAAELAPEARARPSSNADAGAKNPAVVASLTEEPGSLHMAIPPLPRSRLSPLLQSELERVGARQPRPAGSGIDLSRYEAPDPPDEQLTANPAAPETQAAWAHTLRTAYAARAHLAARAANLSLLDAHGANAWLLANAQLEAMGAAVERERATAAETLEGLHRARRAEQEQAAAELSGLAEAWRTAVRGTVDVEVAAEGLQLETLKRRRELAS